MSSGVIQPIPGQTLRWQVDLMNSLYAIGLGLLTIVILPPIFARNVRRSALWFAFLSSWMVYCISFLLLAGNQLGPEPPYGICMFQASVIHAVPALATISGVCFIVDIYFSLHFSVTGTLSWIPKRRAPFLLAIPILAFSSIFIMALVIGLQDHSTVSREPNNMFCHINTGLPTIVSAVLSGWSLFIAFGFEIAAAVLLRRSWSKRSFQKLQDGGSSDPQISLGMVIRVFLFSILTLLALSLSAVMIFHVRPSDFGYNVLLPIMPSLSAILFGSQKDIIMGWRFWKHDTKGPQTGLV